MTVNKSTFFCLLFARQCKIICFHHFNFFSLSRILSLNYYRLVILNLGQFHQHFTSGFYASRSQKHNKDSQLKQLFALLGSAGIKAVCKHVDEIDPWGAQKMGFHKKFQIQDAHWSCITNFWQGINYLYLKNCVLILLRPLNAKKNQRDFQKLQLVSPYFVK